jgi:nicotinamidase-related amidase
MPDQPQQYVRSHELLSRNDSRLLIVDVQEKLTPLIAGAPRMVSNCKRLIKGAKLLGVPVAATEQYPKGLGKIVPELAELLGEVPEKQLFSCAEVLGWGSDTDRESGREKVVVAGIEAHVCVLQTVLDLLSQGFRVYVPADAVASRGELDWKIALDRLSLSGATITTTESVLLISKLIREG